MTANFQCIYWDYLADWNSKVVRNVLIHTGLLWVQCEWKEWYDVALSWLLIEKTLLFSLSKGRRKFMDRRWLGISKGFTVDLLGQRNKALATRREWMNHWDLLHSCYSSIIKYGFLFPVQFLSWLCEDASSLCFNIYFLTFIF